MQAAGQTLLEVLPALEKHRWTFCNYVGSSARIWAPTRGSSVRKANAMH